MENTKEVIATATEQPNHNLRFHELAIWFNRANPTSIYCQVLVELDGIISEKTAINLNYVESNKKDEIAYFAVLSPNKKLFNRTMQEEILIHLIKPSKILNDVFAFEGTYSVHIGEENFISSITASKNERKEGRQPDYRSAYYTPEKFNSILDKI